MSYQAKRLHSKIDFDKVNNVEFAKNKPPAVDTEGFNDYNNLNQVRTDMDGSANSILSEAPDLYKQNGVFMSFNEGFLKIPRSLFNNIHWKAMREKYKKVFLTLLIHTAYAPRSFCVGANLIKIEAGQICISMRNLVDLCNEDVRFKEDKLDKNIVERSVSLFLQIGFVRQEVRHSISIFTISYPEIYEYFKNQHETASETKPRQNRDIKEEREDMNDDYDRMREPEKKNSNEDIEFLDCKGQKQKASLSEVYRRLLKFSPEVVKEAIDRTRATNGPITDIFSYLKVTCERLEKKQKRPENQEKISPKKQKKQQKTSNEPPKCTEPGKPMDKALLKQLGIIT